MASVNHNQSDSGGVKAPTAAVLLIGDELLSGRTADTNLQAIARFLDARGIKLCEARVVTDEVPHIVSAVRDLMSAHSYLFTTGGIGPTPDDRTAEAIARAVEHPLICDPRAEALLRAYYKERGVNEARLKMAMMPEGSELIDNPVSGAPGFHIENIFVMAGVPRIMQAMLAGLDPFLRTGPKIYSAGLAVTAGEGDIAALMIDLQAQHPNVSFGSYPFFTAGDPKISLVTRSVSEAHLAAATEALKQGLAALDIPYVDHDWMTRQS